MEETSCFGGGKKLGRKNSPRSTSASSRWRHSKSKLAGLTGRSISIITWWSRYHKKLFCVCVYVCVCWKLDCSCSSFSCYTGMLLSHSAEGTAPKQAAAHCNDRENTCLAEWQNIPVSRQTKDRRIKIVLSDDPESALQYGRESESHLFSKV